VSEEGPIGYARYVFPVDCVPGNDKLTSELPTNRPECGSAAGSSRVSIGILCRLLLIPIRLRDPYDRTLQDFRALRPRRSEARSRLAVGDLYLHAGFVRGTSTNRRRHCGGWNCRASAALESARAGNQVLVVDMSTVGGGHAIVSNGAVSLVNTPLQQQKGISDSTELASKDFLHRGGDADADWVDLYVKESKRSIYDWLTALGVTFDNLGQRPGNTVPRLHFSHGKGWGLVGPLYRECLRYPNIRFVWATKAEKLIVAKDGTVVGLTATNLRTGEGISFRAKNVIIATGGFGSNLQLVRENWPGWLPQPDRLLAGASQSAVGSGLQIVQDAGGAVSRLDHQWNYVLGLPDPDDPQHMRGLASFDVLSIWVNREGKRFTQEFGDPKINLHDLLHQTDKAYWAIFDSEASTVFP
jgi:uncharacterized protein